MWDFVVDPRDGYSSGNACNSCCCRDFAARPGESNKVNIDYTPWVLPLRGKGLSLQTSIDFLASHSPDVVQIAIVTPLNQTVIVGLPTGSSPIPMYMPNHGTYDFTTDTYTPDAGYEGPDRFFFKDPDGLVGEVAICVGSTGIAPPFLPPIDVPPRKVSVNQKWNTLSFPLVISPAAMPGVVYRITVNQPAMDCDLSNAYTHISCYDVTIGKCGW